MTETTIIEAWDQVRAEGFAELSEGLYLQTFASIKQEHWFGGEMDNWDWRGCEDDDIFILTDTGDVIKISDLEDLLEEVHDQIDDTLHIAVLHNWQDGYTGDIEVYTSIDTAMEQARKEWSLLSEYDKKHHCIAVITAMCKTEEDILDAYDIMAEWGSRK